MKYSALGAWRLQRKRMGSSFCCAKFGAGNRRRDLIRRFLPSTVLSMKIPLYSHVILAEDIPAKGL